MLAAKSAETNTWTRSATSKGDAERALADKQAERSSAKALLAEIDVERLFLVPCPSQKGRFSRDARC